MPTLCDIEHEIAAILADSDKYLPDEVPAVSEYLHGLAIEEAEKIDGISIAVARRIGEIDAMKEYRRALELRIRAAEHRMENFKEYLQHVLHVHGLQKVKGVTGIISLRNSTRVEISIPIQELPEKYCQKHVEYRADKAAIKDAITSGHVVPGAELVTRLSVQIK